MILRDGLGFPIRWWQLWKLSVIRTLEALDDHSCYVCGEPAKEPSRHWPSAMICPECKPRDRAEAAAYARHCETGE